MSLLQRVLHRESTEAIVCPRCATPAPPEAVECTACGWDMRESYHDPVTGVDHEAAR